MVDSMIKFMIPKSFMWITTALPVMPVQRESPILKELKRLVMLNVGRRLPASDVVQLATLMDPSMKDAVDMTHEQKVGD